MATSKVSSPTANRSGTITAETGLTISNATCVANDTVVNLYGEISGTFPANSYIATVSEGFRPKTAQRVLARFQYSSGLVVTYATVETTGRIKLSYGGTNISLCVFMGTIVL